MSGSAASWKAVPIGARMAAAVDGGVDVVMVVDRVGAVGAAEADLRTGLERAGELPVTPKPQVISGESVSEALAEYQEANIGSTFVMSSHGHGRSATVLGSVADELLRATFGPMIVVGPHTEHVGGRHGHRTGEQ